LYVMVDDFCKANLPAEVHPGPKASLSRSEVVTLALFGQWGRFASERDFFRYAQQRLRAAFPTLPNRTQFNPPEADCADTMMLSSPSICRCARKPTWNCSI